VELVASFSAMAEAEMAGLRRFALVVGGESHRADDLVQGSLERVYAVWPRVHRMERPDAYVRRVLVRLALREFSDESSNVDGVLFPDSWAADLSDERVTDVTSPGSGLTLDDVVAPNLLLRVTDFSDTADDGVVDATTGPDVLALLARPSTDDDRLRPGMLRAGDIVLGADDVLAPNLLARRDNRYERDG